MCFYLLGLNITRLRIPDGREADQLAIYKRSRKVELAVKTGFHSISDSFNKVLKANALNPGVSVVILCDRPGPSPLDSDLGPVSHKTR